jgi:hypothetical protein
MRGDILNGLARGFLTPTELKILNGLESLVSAYTVPNGDDYDNAAVPNDPAWHAAMAAAERATRELLAAVSKKTDRRILLGADEREAG